MDLVWGHLLQGEILCGGVGADIKGLRGPERPGAGLIQPARWESESGHRMFESCSWDPDDRVVSGNLRARAQKWAFPPTEEWARKEGFGFQSIHSFIYITYFHRRDSFKGRRGLFSDFQRFGLCLLFPRSSPTMSLLPERRSLEGCM